LHPAVWSCSWPACPGGLSWPGPPLQQLPSGQSTSSCWSPISADGSIPSWPSFSGPAAHRPSLGESYQIEQAKIAIGAGGLNGKGWLQGIQSQQDYVPEQHTDFILTVIAEEFGFLGATAILVGFAILLGWSLYIAFQSASNFGRFAVAGATATVAFYVVFNVAMVLGLSAGRGHAVASDLIRWHSHADRDVLFRPDPVGLSASRRQTQYNGAILTRRSIWR
jgi:hypothetical protein